MNNFEINTTMNIIKKDPENIEIVKVGVINKYNGNEKTVIIPEKVNGLDTVEIGSSAFENNNKIEKIVLPKCVKQIDFNAFYNCTNLKEINLDDVEYIEVGAFNNTSIQNIYIKNLKELKSFAFSACKNLKEVIIEDSLKVVDENAFSGCMQLSKIILPETLAKIKSNAFDKCKNIKELKIPANVKIEKNSFDKKMEDLVFKITNNKKEEYDLAYLLKETKKMKKNEIEVFINKLLKEHKLDNFDPCAITDMNNITFNKENGELTWQCPRCGYCTYHLWNLLENKGKMIDNFNISGCSLCG